MHWSCTRTVLILHMYCTVTVLLLYWFYHGTALILSFYRTGTTLGCRCTGTALAVAPVLYRHYTGHVLGLLRFLHSCLDFNQRRTGPTRGRRRR